MLLLLKKGPKGELRQYVNPVISVNLDNNEITLTRSTDDKTRTCISWIVSFLDKQYDYWSFCWLQKGT